MNRNNTTIVCDKCERTLSSRGMYGFAHQCRGLIRETNERFKKAIAFAGTNKEIREAREARDYANTIYSPMSAFCRLSSRTYYPPRDYPRILS